MDYEKAKKHLLKNDPRLAVVIKQITLPKWHPPESYFIDLVESIISQQLSIKASDTIYGRFKKLFPKEKITPELVLDLPVETVRGVGISYQKVSYIKDLAKHVLESGLAFEQFDIMTDEEIIVELVKVRGIGRWSAEMFLMSIGRPNVFSYGDLGIRNAMKKLYDLDHEPTKEEAEEIAKKWRPYATVACRYLWKSLEL